MIRIEGVHEDTTKGESRFAVTSLLRDLSTKPFCISKRRVRGCISLGLERNVPKDDNMSRGICGVVIGGCA